MHDESPMILTLHDIYVVRDCMTLCIVICNVMPIICMDDYIEGYFAWRCLHVVVEQVKRRAFYTNSSQGVPL